jgi:ABC-2 type transport system ATP-binding protein
MRPIIRTIDLAKRFRHTTVLDDLNLEVAEGSIFGLVGPNGAGKTTAIKILMNILKPASGLAEVLGRDSRCLRPDDFAQIGYVSENQELPDWMTVEYFLAYLKPFYPSWDDSRAAELVRNFDLPRDRKLRHLSRGMWMKAALAASLAYRPRLLVLDEPFSGLDPLVREELIEGVLDSAGECTIFVSSHDLAEIESFASHLAYLDRGRLRFCEEMTSLTSRFREIEVTLERPLPLPEDGSWPPHWLSREASPDFIRFVETRFHPQKTADQVRELFGAVRAVSVNPMPLRAIFITIARNGSKAA